MILPTNCAHCNAPLAGSLTKHAKNCMLSAESLLSKNALGKIQQAELLLKEAAEDADGLNKYEIKDHVQGALHSIEWALMYAKLGSGYALCEGCYEPVAITTLDCPLCGYDRTR